MITSYVKRELPFGECSGLGLPPDGVMFVFMNNGVAEGVDFMCPCGCSVNYYLPVYSPKVERCWEYIDDKDGPTLRPSINHLSGCKSHFHIINGKVSMC